MTRHLANRNRALLTLAATAVLTATGAGGCSADPGSAPEITSPSDESQSDALATTNCKAANPDDAVPDTKAIQACLDNPSLKVVVLARKTQKSSPGLLIDNPYGRTDGALHLPAGKTLTSTGSQRCFSEASGKYFYHDLNCAVLIATTHLPVRMIRGVGDDSVITRLIIDGNGAARRAAHPELCGPGGRPGNVYMEGVDRWVFEQSVSRNAMCGTALLARGADYKIDDNLLKNNGDFPPTAALKQPWADGITVIRCTRGKMTNNRIVDATDVGIAHGGTGSLSAADGCVVAANTFVQIEKHAFSAIGVANFEGTDGGGGLHYGSTFSDNVVIGNGLMDFGIHAGKHPWGTKFCTEGGAIVGNQLRGSFTNLNIDGWKNGKVANNTLTSPEGQAVLLGKFELSCNDQTFTLEQRNFTLGDALNLDRSGQSGAPTDVVFHHGQCIFKPSTNACAY